MICLFSKYKNIFGSPNTGVHQHRFGNIAIVDYIFSIVVAVILSYAYTVPLDLTTVFVLVFASFSHLLFGVSTASIKYLGLIC